MKVHWFKPESHFQTITLHIDLCAIEYSLGDAQTALKHGDKMSPYLAFDVKFEHCLSQPFMRIAD